MIRCRKGKCILLGVVILLGAFFSFNFYIIKELNRDKPVIDLDEDIENQIIHNVKQLNPTHFLKNPEYDDVFYQLQLMFDPGVKPLWSKSPAQLWTLVNRVSHN